MSAIDKKIEELKKELNNKVAAKSVEELKALIVKATNDYDLVLLVLVTEYFKKKVSVDEYNSFLDEGKKIYNSFLVGYQRQVDTL